MGRDGHDGPRRRGCCVWIRTVRTARWAYSAPGPSKWPEQGPATPPTTTRTYRASQGYCTCCVSSWHRPHLTAPPPSHLTAPPSTAVGRHVQSGGAHLTPRRANARHEVSTDWCPACPHALDVRCDLRTERVHYSIHHQRTHSPPRPPGADAAHPPPPSTAVGRHVQSGGAHLTPRRANARHEVSTDWCPACPHALDVRCDLRTREHSITKTLPTTTTRRRRRAPAETADLGTQRSSS